MRQKRAPRHSPSRRFSTTRLVDYLNQAAALRVGLNGLSGRGIRERFQAAATLATVRDHRQRRTAGSDSGELPERCTGLAACPLGLPGDVTVTLVEQEAFLKLAITSDAFIHG